MRKLEFERTSKLSTYVYLIFHSWIVRKKLSVAAKKAAELKKRLEPPVTGDKPVLTEPELFKPDSVVQQFVKKKRSLISSKKAKAEVASSAAQPVPEIPPSVSALVKRPGEHQSRGTCQKTESVRNFNVQCILSIRDGYEIRSRASTRRGIGQSTKPLRWWGLYTSQYSIDVNNSGCA